MGEPVYWFLISGIFCLFVGIYYIVLAVENPDEVIDAVMGSVLSAIGILLLGVFGWTSKPKAKPKAKPAPAPAQNSRY